MESQVTPFANKQNIDKDKLQRMLPKGTNHKVTDEIIAIISSMEEDVGLYQDYMEESLLTHLPVLSTTKTDLDDYVNAIKYCNLKQNMSNTKAWEIVFPDRVKSLQEKGTMSFLSSHVAMFNKRDIVVKLDAQMMISIHIQYAPVFHKSMHKLIDLSNGISADGTPVSAHVQFLSAKELVEQTKMPEDNTIELKIGMSDEAKSVQEKLTEQLARSVDIQMKRLDAGESISDIQSIGISQDKEFIEAEYDDDNNRHCMRN